MFRTNINVIVVQLALNLALITTSVAKVYKTVLLKVIVPSNTPFNLKKVKIIYIVLKKLTINSVTASTF